MKFLFSFSCALWVSLVSMAQAQSPVVVELFTSQGCSACPPADELLRELAERDDVIALALHVDYWDYIGWKDEFADAAYTKRQRGYAIEGGRKSIYTPQMIINGTTDIVGARPMQLSKAITEHAAQPSLIALDLAQAGEGRVRIKATTETTGSYVVHMVRYQPRRVSKITRGENAGKTLKYANVTEEWNVLTDWDGKAPLDLVARAKGDAPVVVLVQQGQTGPILAAAQLR